METAHGQPIASPNASGDGSQTQPFCHARSFARLDCTGGDDHQMAASFRQCAAATASFDAGCGVGILGNLVMTAFVALAVGMAAYAIHQEQRLAPQEKQLLQRVQ